MVQNLKLIDTDKLNRYEEGSWLKLSLEAISTCPKIKKEREIKILAERFGLGKNIKTLNAIGKQYNLTRERIRQIVNNSLKKVKNNCVNKELKKRISEIEKIAEQKGGLVSEKYLEEYFNLKESHNKNGLYFTVNLSQKLIPLKETNVLKISWVTSKNKITKVNEITKKTAEILHKENRVLTTKEILSSFVEDGELVKSVLESSKQIMKTEDGNWGLVIWPNVNPKSIKDKSKFILIKHQKPMHYSELTDRIGGISKKQVTKQSVHNELIKNSDFVLIGRGIYALSEWGYNPGVVEEVIIEVLKTAGEPLHKNEIVKRVKEKRIVKESTIVLNLQKNKFKRVSKAVYTLN